MDIEFKNVTKKYGEITCLEDVSFDVKRGEFVFITGRSGAGKSTLIRLILGEIFPNEGQIFVGEIEIKKKNLKEILFLRKKIGVVFQDFRLLDNKTIEENILTAMSLKGIGREDWPERLESSLAAVDLIKRADFFPAQLSGGEIQKACLARALATNPEMILADEPTGNLDPESSWELMEIFKRINKKGITIIMATHNFDIVNSFHQRVIKLENGRLVSDKKGGRYE